jgi:hypothetical protein
MHIRSTLTASFVAAALATAFAAPSQANILINIDKSSQRMSVSVDGQHRYSWPVSTGRAGYNTPSGTFKPNRMDADHQSQEWDNAPMPHSIFFDLRGHAIHGFFDVKHLGLPVSHGCVRLAPANAATLFALVKSEGMAETKVVISGQNPEGAPAVARRRPAPVETDAAAAPVQIAPRESGYRPNYNQGYQQQPYDQGYRQSYDQGYGRSYYPPQPPPVYQQQYFRPYGSY